MDKGLSQCFLALVAVLLLYRVKAIPLAEFYPFGNALGDKGLFRNDDGSSLVLNLTTSFPFFNRDHLTLFVSSHICVIKCNSNSKPYNLRQVLGIGWGCYMCGHVAYYHNRSGNGQE